IAGRNRRFDLSLRGNAYWAGSLLLTLLVGALLVVALRPPGPADPAFAARPYGLTTGLENLTTDQLFQWRDARDAALGQRGRPDPIVIMGIDDDSFRSVGLRAQNWPRSYYAKLIDRA